jgi:hypothetical protein
MAVSTKMPIFWVAVPCRLVWVYHSFRAPYCLHLQSIEQATHKESVRDKGTCQSKQNLDQTCEEEGHNKLLKNLQEIDIQLAFQHIRNIYQL